MSLSFFFFFFYICFLYMFSIYVFYICFLYMFFFFFKLYISFKNMKNEEKKKKDYGVEFKIYTASNLIFLSTTLRYGERKGLR